MRSLTGQWLGGLSLLVVLTLVVGSGMELRALANPSSVLERIAATAITPRFVAIARRQHERPIALHRGSGSPALSQPGVVTDYWALFAFSPVSTVSVLHLNTPPPASA